MLAFNLLLVPAYGQAAWPSQPIKIIVPFPAGGASDQIGRIMAKAIGDELKATVVVENRSGANGSVGAAAVAKAAPDGYTLLVGSIGVFAINAGLYSKLPYDPVKDFAPISVLVSTPNVLVVPANSRFKTAARTDRFHEEESGQACRTRRRARDPPITSRRNCSRRTSAVSPSTFPTAAAPLPCRTSSPARPTSCSATSAPPRPSSRAARCAP